MPKDILENFKKSWEGEIAKIEKEAIDGNGISLIRLHFEHGKLMLEMNRTEESFTEEMHELDMLKSKLEVALQIAHSRYRLQNRSLWARIFGGIFKKIPEKKI